jgi:hypothetical protein
MREERYRPTIWFWWVLTDALTVQSKQTQPANIASPASSTQATAARAHPKRPAPEVVPLAIAETAHCFQ